MDAETKKKAQTILNQVGNGFNARKRGLMLNYQLGKRQKKQEKEAEANASIPTLIQVDTVKTEVGQEDDIDIEAIEKSPVPMPQRPIQDTIIEPKPDYSCGGPDCNRKFKSIASRTRHRSKVHPDLCFIDTEEDLYVFR